MKIKWNKGTPEKAGYYLCWDPMEEPFPFVLKLSFGEGGYEWWEFVTHKAVISESMDGLLQTFEIFFNDWMEGKDKKTQALAKEIIDDWMSDDNETYFVKKESIRRSLDDGTWECYDTGRPEWWAELPYLYECGNDDAIEAAMIEGDPTQLNVEIEDKLAVLINDMVERVSSVYRDHLASSSSPWARKDVAPPWAGSDGRTEQ